MLKHREKPQPTGLKQINERPIQFVVKVVTAFLIGTALFGVGYLGIRFLMFSFWDSLIFVVIIPVLFYLVITKRRIIEQAVQTSFDAVKSLGAKVETIFRRESIVEKLDFEEHFQEESLKPETHNALSRIVVPIRNAENIFQGFPSSLSRSTFYSKLIYYFESLKPHLKYLFGDNKSHQIREKPENIQSSETKSKQPIPSPQPKLKPLIQLTQLEEPKREVWTIEDIPLNEEDTYQKENRQPYGWQQDK